jgi:hypothetical protein
MQMELFRYKKREKLFYYRNLHDNIFRMSMKMKCFSIFHSPPNGACDNEEEIFSFFFASERATCADDFFTSLALAFIEISSFHQFVHANHHDFSLNNLRKIKSNHFRELLLEHFNVHRIVNANENFVFNTWFNTTANNFST